MFVAQKLLRFEGIHVDRRRNRHMTSIAEEQGRIQCEKTGNNIVTCMKFECG